MPKSHPAHNKLSQEEAYQRFINYGYEPLEPYINNRTRISCRDKEGYIVKVSIDSLGRCKSYQRFSPTCNKENILHNLSLWGKRHNYHSIVLDIEPNPVTKQKWNVVCQCDCENKTIFKLPITEWLRGTKTRCNNCTRKISNIALIVKEFLDYNKINYIQEFRFNNCRYKRALPFDFYLPDYNVCIEVDGEQHFYENSKMFSFRHGETFEKRKKKDDIKTEYCLNNNIGLIRLRYSVVRNKQFEFILINQLNLYWE